MRNNGKIHKELGKVISLSVVGATSSSSSHTVIVGCLFIRSWSSSSSFKPRWHLRNEGISMASCLLSSCCFQQHFNSATRSSARREQQACSAMIFSYPRIGFSSVALMVVCCCNGKRLRTFSLASLIFKSFRAVGGSTHWVIWAFNRPPQWISTISEWLSHRPFDVYFSERALIGTEDEEGIHISSGLMGYPFGGFFGWRKHSIKRLINKSLIYG